MGVDALCKNDFYQFSGLKLVHELKGHTKEVDDVTCHPDNHMVWSEAKLLAHRNFNALKSLH